MNQRCRLESMTGRFTRHFVCGQAAEFVIHQRQQIFSGFRIALLQAIQNLSDFAH
jgi:hypothetical protein